MRERFKIFHVRHFGATAQRWEKNVNLSMREEIRRVT
jgi:hypothetical protein